MTLESAASAAEAFLEGYVQEKGYFTPDEEIDAGDAEDPGVLRLSFFRAVPHPTQPSTIMYTFVYGREVSKDDPELDEWVQQCMEALKQTHPEVSQFKSHINLKRFSGG